MRTIKSVDDLIKDIGDTLESSDYISCNDCPVTKLCEFTYKSRGSYGSCTDVIRKAFDVVNSIYSLQEEEQC